MADWRGAVAAVRSAASDVVSRHRVAELETQRRTGIGVAEAESRHTLQSALPSQRRHIQRCDFAREQMLHVLSEMRPGISALLSNEDEPTIEMSFDLVRRYGACSLWPSLVSGGIAMLNISPSWHQSFEPGIVLRSARELLLGEGIDVDWNLHCNGALTVRATLRLAQGTLNRPPPNLPLIVWALRRAPPGYARLNHVEKMLRVLPCTSAEVLRAELEREHWDHTGVREALSAGEWEEGVLCSELVREVAEWLPPWLPEPSLGQYLRGERAVPLTGFLSGAEWEFADTGRPQRLAGWQVLPDEASVRRLAETRGDADCKKQAALVAARAGQLTHPDLEAPQLHPVYGGGNWLRLRFSDGQILFTAWEAVIPPLCDPTAFFEEYIAANSSPRPR
eukprot:TRINITY_DN46970_c0_g1_i1.p1 TRINITY_DN46970_c0_g1~~TRINITY_DN46970_c0_g1_i1.p1  ORF type:complete len:409 (+),score=119.05 TRINITY_DN46970_c0_g1_i1:51-1229(+)